MVFEGSEGRYFGFDCELEPEERVASCFSIDVSGS